MRFLLLAASLAFTVCAFGQTPPLAFEVASVKPAPPSDPHHLHVNMDADAGRLTYTNVTLRDLIRTAYEVKDSQIAGLEWINSERYDMVAKIPAGANHKQIPQMLQTLLTERFKLTLSRGIKTMPVYELVVAKGGVKLQESAEGKGSLSVNSGSKGHRMSGNVELSKVAESLSTRMDRPVIDMTGLKGSYLIDLEWSDDDKATGDADHPSVFSALQDKLGLKLEAKKAPIEILTVEHAEKVPTEN